MTEGDLTLGGEHTMQYTEDIGLYARNLYNFTQQCHSPINSIKKIQKHKKESYNKKRKV